MSNSQFLTNSGTVPEFQSPSFSQQCCDVSVSCFFADELPLFWMSWASQKNSVLETRETERALSETKSSGSGKESPRLALTGLSCTEITLVSSLNSLSAATHRRMPRSMISATDRKRTDAGSRGSPSSVGRNERESVDGSASMERPAREPNWHPSQIYLCKTAARRPITHWHNPSEITRGTGKRKREIFSRIRVRLYLSRHCFYRGQSHCLGRGYGLSRKL
jgi:hypothetical protein